MQEGHVSYSLISKACFWLVGQHVGSLAWQNEQLDVGTQGKERQQEAAVPD